MPIMHNNKSIKSPGKKNNNKENKKETQLDHDYITKILVAIDLLIHTNLQHVN